MGNKNKPLRKLKIKGSKQYSTVEYGAKPQKGNVYQYILDLNNRDYDNDIIDDYEWYQNLKDIIDTIPTDELSIYDTNQDSMLMPEMTYHAGLSPKKILHRTTDAYAARSLQRSFDIIANNPDLYGTFLSKRFKSRSPSSFRKSQPEIISSMPPGFENAAAITTPIGSAYTEYVLYGTDLSKNIRAHELNHALWNNMLLNMKHKKVKNIIYDAYSPHEGDFDKHNSGSEIDELIASNSDLRNHLYEHGFDPNEYNFFKWDKERTGEYEPFVNMPALSGYFPSIRTSIENYANNRYNELINERGEDHADEIRDEITDEINQRIRLALSKVAYNQAPNQDQPLYAKAGGILIPKFGEGSGAVDWLLRQIAKVSPKAARLLGYTKELSATEKEIAILEKGLQGQSKNLQGLQKGVQRAQKISKSQQFKELVNGLELDDRVSSELISRYEALDPKTQSTERKMLLRLMKNNQIHSIADFGLVVDKVHSNRMGGNPNILGIETISDLDTPFAESWNRKQKEKQEYDRALGTFTKIYNYPEINYTAYEVPATRQGQQDLLTVMKGQYNKKIQPWCVIETDKKTGELTPAAIERWDKEYAGSKFALMDKKGKIRYFMSGNSGWFDMNDKRTVAIREFKPTIQIGNGPGYRMFKLPELHSYKTVNPDKMHFYLDWETPLSVNISKDLSDGTRIDKTPSGYTIYHRGPHDPKTSVFLHRDSSLSVHHSKSGPLPGLRGNWYKTQSGKSRFVLDSFLPHAYTILDESGNVLKDKIKNNSLLFHNNMMLMQNGKNARLFRGKDQESLLKFALNGEDLDTGYAETLFGVTPLYEQFGTRHGINSWDLSNFGKKATDLPSALNKFGFQLPELKKGGTIIEEKN